MMNANVIIWTFVNANAPQRAFNDAMLTSKEAFLRGYEHYGYGVDQHAGATARRVDRMRAEDFPQLQDSTYLDHAGATLYSKSQIQRSLEELQHGLFSNPHSQASLQFSLANGSSAHRVASVRRHILRFFNANEEEYSVVFTSGATAAIKLVGECFPWSKGSSFVHSMDSHTSVLGLRGYANDHGAQIQSVQLDHMRRMEEQAAASTTLEQAQSTHLPVEGPCHLFAFPAECNFSGTQHDLNLISHVHKNGYGDSAGQWLVLLDAAKYVASHRLDLSAYKPDFVSLSFYKLFGYPTGIGALLVRKRAMPLLQKTYYGGGTVLNISASRDFVRLRDKTDNTRLEDGTISFLSVISLRHGLELLDKLTVPAITQHVSAVYQLLRAELQSLKHWNGVEAVKIYGSPEEQGSLVSFNFRRFDGSFVGFAEVGKLASIHNIHLRTGCFCNPGACQWYLGLREDDILDSMAAGHVCGDDMDIVNGRPTGAVRLSIGYMTTFEDIQSFVEFAVKYFVAVTPPPVPTTSRLEDGLKEVVLRKLVLFPIKSCAGMSVNEWPVGSRGLLYDREWAILDSSTRKALTLKDSPELCFLEPIVDLSSQTLTIRCRKTNDRFTLPLSTSLGGKYEENEDMRVCAGSCKGRDVGEEVSKWLSQRLQRACRLVRVAADSARSAGSSKSSPSSTSDTKIGFANQAQFLLISRASVAHLNKALDSASAGMQIREDAFRANLILDSTACEAFAEDTWSHIRIGDVAFDVTGPCGRCSMINIDPTTGAFHRAPLQMLSRYRRERSNIFFGQFLAVSHPPPGALGDEEGVSSPASPSSLGVAWLHCGSRVEVEVKDPLH